RRVTSSESLSTGSMCRIGRSGLICAYFSAPSARFCPARVPSDMEDTVIEGPPTAAAKRRFLPELVVKNAFALYGVQIGRKLIPLASIPYLARVLGPEGWGEVAFV